GGLRELSAQQFTYARVAADGITVVPAMATAVDAAAKSVTLDNGTRLAYDLLVLAPGIDILWGALLGYDEAAAAATPHIWQGANVIPPQKAGRIAEAAGVADRSGWCPIDPVTFESKLQPGIHVVGDAAIAGAMPKSAFAANSQAKSCAAAVVRLLAGGTPATS